VPLRDTGKSLLRMTRMVAAGWLRSERGPV